MKKIKIVGMGPGPKKLLTLEANEILKSVDKIFFRTILHPVAEKLIDNGVDFKTYDAFYDKYDDFDDLHEAISKDLIASINEGEEIVYAVPGNPLMYDDTVKYLFDTKGENLEIEVIYGASLHDVVMASIDMPVTDAILISNALEIKKHNIDYKKDNLIIGVFNQYIASNIKIDLLVNYDLEHIVYFIYGAKTEEEYIEKIHLEDIDRLDKYNHLTCIFIPKNNNRKSFSDFIEIMDYLRSEDGCAWDRKQTNKSLIPYTIEEVYEVISAIENDDFDHLSEELGDLLLQVVFYAQINSEEGYFDIYDVIDEIVKKLIRRHPHIFSNDEYGNGEDDIRWEQIKKEEYNENYIYESMQRIPSKLPPLMKAYKIQEKAAKVGFDWDSIAGAIDKLFEEIDELMEIKDSGNVNLIIDELGDVLFSIVNVARFLQVRPEVALESTNKKFISRFKKMEHSNFATSKEFSSLSLDEMEKLWEKAKK